MTGSRSSASARRRHRGALAALLLPVTVGGGILGVTLLGRSASSKFSSVGWAVSDQSGHWREGLAETPAAPATSSPGPPDSPTTGPPTPGANALVVNAIDRPVTAGRSFVSTASMTVQTDDLAAAANRAIVVVTRAGGGVFGEQSSFHRDATSVMTFKVPPEVFRSVMIELAQLGELVSQEVTTDDVTEQVIDLDARISAAESTLARTRELLDKARTLQEITSLENEVGRRQADLEKLRGQQRSLRERVDLATITLTVVMPAPPAEPATPTTVAARPLPGFTDGLSEGWESFTAAGSVAPAGIGLVLPFALVAVPLGVVMALVRRRRRPHGGAAPPTLAEA